MFKKQITKEEMSVPILLMDGNEVADMYFGNVVKETSSDGLNTTYYSHGHALDVEVDKELTIDAIVVEYPTGCLEYAFPARVLRSGSRLTFALHGKCGGSIMPRACTRARRLPHNEVQSPAPVNH